ncbi:MAG: SUMF1/EgtB/PvdO family nonheme iron enzyme [Chloroflexi bacterium]|nr:SUMF1/EgtB/PvdO family nonheme iron enzyme [Chloroflexota bacterium]
MPDSVNTNGGAVIGRDVNTGGGTFIGRDQIILVNGYTGQDLEQVLARLQETLAGGRADLCADIVRARLTVTAPGAPAITLSAQAARDLLPAAARQADERAYLTALLVNPRYGRWASQFVPLAGTLTPLERPPGWSDVPPEFTLLEVVGAGAGRQVRRTRLDDITEATTRYEALALLGEPGAGKTTTLHKLALDAARQRLTGAQRWLPIFLSLADYRDFPTPHAFVQSTWTQLLGCDDLAGRLRGGGLLLLCDALNEMPFRDERDYRDRVDAWRRFVGEWPGNRFIFTCRSRDYGEPLGLPQVEIERLDDARVRDFLGKYLSPDLAGRAWQHLDSSPLLELVRNPYYLSMLAYILAQGGDWPANRARLFDGFVNLLLRREQSRHHPDWPGLLPLQNALATLAERIQPGGEGTRLPRRQFLAQIPAQVAGSDGPVDVSPQAVVRLGLAATLLDSELASGGAEIVRFYHHQLQEYFAARALRDRFQAGENLSGRWRVPRRVSEMPAPGPLGDFEPLPSPPVTGWEEPAILAAGLADDPAAFVQAVRQVNPVLAARCLVEAGIEPPPALATAVQEDLLRELGDRQVHLRARLAAGDVLGRLGDPRFRAITVTGQRVLLPPLAHVSAGSYRIGSGRWRVWKLAFQGFPGARDEQPRHRVELPEFWIGRYPITNAEYACFIAAGGYRHERYWPTAAGRAWLRGEAAESGVVKQLMDVWRALREKPALLQQLRRAGWSSRDVATWEPLLQRNEIEVRELFSRQVADRPRDRPAFWDDERYGGPSQPVVGVTWYEALAYCCWLDEQARAAGVAAFDLPEGYTIRLPTEAEWEGAARRGRGWIYPWGNRWDAAWANTWEGHVLRPSPVGVYDVGATPDGIHDLAGNVWEWTQSVYQPYPCRPDDGRNNLEAEGVRVVRGGSWRDNQWNARCACRGRLVSGGYDAHLGFRVVVSLSS